VFVQVVHKFVDRVVDEFGVWVEKKKIFAYRVFGSYVVALAEAFVRIWNIFYSWEFSIKIFLNGFIFVVIDYNYFVVCFGFG
jgi:hypothetical protein